MFPATKAQCARKHVCPANNSSSRLKAKLPTFQVVLSLFIALPQLNSTLIHISHMFADVVVKQSSFNLAPVNLAEVIFTACSAPLRTAPPAPLIVVSNLCCSQHKASAPQFMSSFLLLFEDFLVFLDFVMNFPNDNNWPTWSL